MDKTKEKHYCWVCEEKNYFTLLSGRCLKCNKPYKSEEGGDKNGIKN